MDNLLEPLKPVKLLFHDNSNMGDFFNITLFNEIFGRQVECSNPIESDIVALGGGLTHYFLDKDYDVQRWGKCEIETTEKPVYVWRTGFLTDDFPWLQPRRPFIIKALRGQLTKEILEKTLKSPIDCVLADPGLLAGLLAQKLFSPQPKKYKLGIIPHFLENKHPAFYNVQENTPNSIMINILQEPISFLKQIAQCEYIVSSSLHGLVMSDSLGIPNLWIRCKYQAKRKDFSKYRDYYSSFNVEPNGFSIIEGDVPSISAIKDSYEITSDMVAEKQEQLLQSFPLEKQDVPHLQALYREISVLKHQLYTYTMADKYKQPPKKLMHKFLQS
ncbi:MAG: polysaccharide pyruvyl transferase family protein [Defluviitaleaceae bacterium]|nr:polysaccharide pyruvyl transferase family protein [Defluviitaleaceae bacterium]